MMETSSSLPLYLSIFSILLLGAGLWTYLPVRNARSPRERAFLVRVSVVAWAATILFVLLPEILYFNRVIPYWLAIAPMILLTAAVLGSIDYVNKRVASLRINSRSKT